MRRRVEEVLDAARHRPPPRTAPPPRCRAASASGRGRRRPRRRPGGARARRAHLDARPPGRRRRARRRGPPQRRPRHDRPAGRAPPRAGRRRWPTAPWSLAGGRVARPAPPAPCSATSRARPRSPTSAASSAGTRCPSPSATPAAAPARPRACSDRTRAQARSDRADGRRATSLVAARGRRRGAGGRTACCDGSTWSVRAGRDRRPARAERVRARPPSSGPWPTWPRPCGGTIDRAARVAYVPQDPYSLLFSPTVRAEVAETCRLLGRRDRGGSTAGSTGWASTRLADRHPRSLSTGERQRVAVAAVAVGGAPCSCSTSRPGASTPPPGPPSSAAVAEHAAGGGAVVLATHDVELAARCATRVVVLGDGDVVAHGPGPRRAAGLALRPPGPAGPAPVPHRRRGGARPCERP